MALRIGRTLPPAAAPVSLLTILTGVAGIINGQNSVSKFAEELKEYHKVKYCFLLSSGKAALSVVLQALKLNDTGRDEVLIPAYTCYSVPAAIVRAGLKIRLCDVDPDTLDFDYDELEAQLSNPRLLCVIPTHLFGLTADIPRVRELIGARDITIVEDAAQAMGGESNSLKFGTQGDIGLFSLGRGKVITTVEGGIILTDCDPLGASLKDVMASVASYGIVDYVKLIFYAVILWIFMRPWTYWFPCSLPFLGLGETHFDTNFSINRMTPFQAGMARGWQQRIKTVREIRLRAVSRFFSAGFKTVNDAKLPAGLIRFPAYVADRKKKEEILAISNRLGLGMSDMYPDSIDGISGIDQFIAGGSGAKAKVIAAQLLSLPVHPFVKQKDIERVIKTLNVNGELLH